MTKITNGLKADAKLRRRTTIRQTKLQIFLVPPQPNIVHRSKIVNGFCLDGTVKRIFKKFFLRSRPGKSHSRHERLLIQTHFNFFLQLGNGVFEQHIGVHHILHGFARVNHRAVVAPAEGFADGFERLVG